VEQPVLYSKYALDICVSMPCLVQLVFTYSILNYSMLVNFMPRKFFSWNPRDERGKAAWTSFTVKTLRRGWLNCVRRQQKNRWASSFNLSGPLTEKENN
jgi:hypothetical protein